MSFYNKELESLDRGQLREHQNSRLRSLLIEIAANEFYREKFKAAGLELSSVETYDDLSPLPFTTKGELVKEQLAHPPYGRLLTYTAASYRYLHQTSGTTGRPLKWLDTAETWDWWAHCWAYVYRAAGVTDEDIVFCAFSFGPYISHWSGITGAWRVGAMAVSGGGMNSEQRLQSILDNRCTVILCTPTYALHMAEVARRLGVDLRSSGIRLGIHAGEPGASLPNVRRAIEDAWGMTCFDHAGATEVGAWGFACRSAPGAVHLNEAEFIFEVIDPQTCKPVEDGRRGELVITNLGRPCMPVLRYRTGDLVEVVRQTCDCGRSFASLRGGVLGRADDMMIVRGVNLYPGAIDDLMRGLPGVAEYEVVIRRVAEMSDLLIKVETVEPDSFEYVCGLVLNAFRNQFNIRVSVEQSPPGGLPRYEFKAKRFKREEIG